MATLSFGGLLSVAGLTSIPIAQAQSFTWGGTGSTTVTTDYNLGTNWANPPASAPPVAAGQSAVFDATGSATVAVTAGPIAPDSWTFSAGAQPYSISGAAVNFSLAGAGGGIIDNASSSQAISISNDIGEAVAGVQVQLLGFSTLLLSGTNTYSGGTKVSGFGTLQVTNNSSVGTGTVTLENGQFQAGADNLAFSNSFKINSTPAGSAIDSNGYTLTVAGNITDGSGGAGKLTILDSFGGGVVILTGANTYTGGTTICSCAALQLGDATHTASILGAVTNENIFNIVKANTTGITTLLNDGGLTTFFSGTSASTMTIINRHGGETDFVGDSSAGHATIVNRYASLTTFNGTSTAANANITNRYAGATLFFDGSSADSATITTNRGGVVQFHDNSNGGKAQFITNGTGYVDFGDSVGRNGDGRITAGSIAGSGIYYIGGFNTLIVGSNDLSTTVSGVIADFNPCGCAPGPGALEKVGTGTLTLSGTNSYTGTTTVFGGVLDVEGTIASSSLTTVNAKASLTGAGFVGNTDIAGGGIFLPGNGTPGTFMTVAGNLAFQSGALYLVQLNSVASTFANVTGSAALAGTVGASFAPGSTVQKQYMILTAAGGHSGGFAGAGVLGAPGGLVATLSYDPTHVFINFALDFSGTPGVNVNQKNVGNTLTNFFNANGGIPVAFATLSGAGLSQVSGETATGTQQATFDAMNLFLGLLTDPFIDGRGGSGPPGFGAPPFAAEGDNASAYAAKKRNSASDAFAKFPTKAEVARNNLLDPRWSVWGAAFGGGSTTDGNAAAGSNAATARVFGFAAGADYLVSPATLAGFALAGGGTNFSANGFGSGRSDLFQAGAFVRHTIGAAYVTGALAYGWQDVTTDRTVTTAGVDRLHAQFDANAWSGRVEGGYRYITPWMGVTPYAAGQFTTYSLPAYAEQVLSGAGAFALNYAARDVTASRSELGVRADRSFAMPNAVLTLRGRLAWAHDFNTDRNISAVFQTLPGAAFVVGGAAQAHDSALTTASAEVKWLNGWSAAATFEGQFSDVTTSYAGKGVVRYMW